MPSFFWNKKNNRENLNIQETSFPINFLLFALFCSVNIFFGFVKFVNFFSIKFYYFYSPKIVDISIFGNLLDWVVWGVSFFVILAEVFLLSFRKKSLPVSLNWFCFAGIAVFLLSLFGINYADLFGFPISLIAIGLCAYFGFGYYKKRSANYLVVMLGLVCIVVLISVASLFTWVWNIFDYNFPFVDFSHWRFALVDLYLFNVLYPWVPWLFLALFYSWAWIPLVKRAFVKVGSLRNISEHFSSFEGFSHVKFNRRMLIALLLIMVGVAVFVSYYPFFSRSSSSLVGSDSAVYYGWMQDMAQSGPWIALNTDRPLSNLFMYGIQNGFGLSSEAIVRLMPIICCVGLSLAVFWFVRVGLHNDFVAFTSGFFTIFSFQTTVGIYAYSISNWLGLIWAFLILGSILKSSSKYSWGYSFIAALFGVALLFTHPYTWDVIVAVLLAYLLWQLLRLYLKRSSAKLHIIQLGSVLIFNFVAYGIYSILPFGKGVTSGGVGFAGRSLVFPNILGLQDGLKTSAEMWVGGLYGNPLLLILAILGMIAIVGFASRFNRLMFLWVMLPSLVLFVVSSENYMFYRIFYVLPVQVLAAIGIFWVFRFFESKYLLNNSRRCWLCKVGLLSLVVLLFFTYALRSVDGAPLHIP